MSARCKQEYALFGGEEGNNGAIRIEAEEPVVRDCRDDQFGHPTDDLEWRLAHMCDLRRRTLMISDSQELLDEHTVTH